MNKKDKLKLISFAAGALTTSVLAYIGNYFYNYAINKKLAGPKNEMKTEALDINENIDIPHEVILGDMHWLKYESNYENVTIKSFDNLTLHAYKILNPSVTNNWVITIHGYNSDGAEMTNYAKKFYEEGYNVLIPDLRAHGYSEGNYIGMGWHDRLDIIEWIKFIINENPNAQLILHGVSMGAATACMVSGEELPSNVKAIIADCGYSSVWEEFSYQLKQKFKLPKFPFLHAASIVTRIKAGYSFKKASVVKQVSKSKTPILFIHGDKDDYVPYEMMDKLYKAAKCPKEKITILGADHAKCVVQDPDTYWTSIKNFVSKHINS